MTKGQPLGIMIIYALRLLYLILARLCCWLVLVIGIHGRRVPGAAA
jgi:hypothetical protein